MGGEADWRSLCEGEVADRVRSTVFDLADAIREHDWAEPSLREAGGAAVLFSYMDRVFPDRGYDDALDRCVEFALAEAARREQEASFYCGFSGLGWCLEHVYGSDPEASAEDDANEAVDGALGLLLAPSPWDAQFDLLGGLVGMGVYALERVPRPSAAVTLARIVHHLQSTCRPRRTGVAWWTPPDDTGAPERWPDGQFNLGAAHGSPGVIALLGQAAAVPFPEVASAARPLLEQAVQYLLDVAQPPGAHSRFAAFEGQDVRTARTGWCYGDPGVAASLLVAARAIEHSGWEQLAIEVALDAALRSPERAQVLDACLCHGSAGLAHMFNRFFQATADQRFAECARRWIQHTLDLRGTENGAAGFQFLMDTGAGRKEWTASMGFLDGAVGVCLSLLAAISDVTPDWDRALLCNIPPRA